MRFVFTAQRKAARGRARHVPSGIYTMLYYTILYYTMLYYTSPRCAFG